MKNIFWGGYLVAVLATSCHSSPTSGETTAPAFAITPPTLAAMARTSAPPERRGNQQEAAMLPGTNGPSARAEALRLHDAVLNQMDVLATEHQRLTSALKRIAAATPRAARLRRMVTTLQQADRQMMDWMHQL